MSTPGRSESTNEMDELRHVQLLLKREEVFNDFQQSEIKELNTSLRNQSKIVLNLQKFLLFVHMESMGDVAVNLKSKFFDSLCIDSPKDKFSDPKGQTTQCPQAQVTLYNKVIGTFTENPAILAQAVSSVFKNKPEKIDIMTFSTIPGLFSYIWSTESGDAYLNFLKQLNSIDPESAIKCSRVIFSLPPFHLFFKSVTSDFTDEICTLSTPEKAEEFTQRFISKWNESVSFCPSIVKSAILLSPDPIHAFTEAFFNPAFQSPRTFSILPLSIRIPPSQSPGPLELFFSALKPHIPELWEAINNVSNPATLPSAENLMKILPDLCKNAFFVPDDLACLKLLVGASGPDFPVKENQLEVPSQNEEYLPCTFTLPSVQEVRPNGEATTPLRPEEEIEQQLRLMLIGVDVIPLAAQSSGKPDMVELLKSQVQLARPDHRLLLEMKIDDFESARKKSQENWEFEGFLRLLKDKFNERQNERLQKLSKISLYNTEFSQMFQLSKSLETQILSYQEVLIFHLMDKWISIENPFAEISDELYLDPNNFYNFFRQIYDKWTNWCKSNGYNFLQRLTQNKSNTTILHNLVMRELPLKKFLELHPEDVERDRLCFEGLRDKKDTLLKNNSFDFTATFQENPTLLDGAKKQLKAAFDAPLPLVKLNYISDALLTLVFVLNFEGHKEVGADQWVPMSILLLVLADPEHFPSNMHYIEHFVKSIEDPKVINENIDYNFTMLKSALIHFNNEIPGIADKQEQNGQMM